MGFKNGPSEIIKTHDEHLKSSETLLRKLSSLAEAGSSNQIFILVFPPYHSQYGIVALTHVS